MANIQVGMTVRNPLNPLVNGLEFKHLKPRTSWLGPPPDEATEEGHQRRKPITGVCSMGGIAKLPTESHRERIITNERYNDYEDPLELDCIADDFCLAQEGHRTNVDRSDDHSSDRDPFSNRHLIRPEFKYSICGCQFICDGDAKREPVCPSKSKGGGRVNKPARPLNEGGWKWIHHSHFSNGMCNGPDHCTR